LKTPPVMIASGEPLIKVDVGLSAGAVVDKEFLGAGGPGETPDRTAGQAQLPGGLRQVPALGQQAVHVSVPGPASDPPGSRQLQGCRLAGRRGQLFAVRVICAAGHRGDRGSGRAADHCVPRPPRTRPGQQRAAATRGSPRLTRCSLRGAALRHGYSSRPMHHRGGVPRPLRWPHETPEQGISPQPAYSSAESGKRAGFRVQVPPGHSLNINGQGL
jgi:hypothetical protein